MKHAFYLMLAVLAVCLAVPIDAVAQGTPVPVPQATKPAAATQGTTKPTTPVTAAQPRQPQPAAGKNPVVLMETSMGTIKIELFQDRAPITVQNFLSYVQDKFYDGTIFHRVINDFMIQGGGFLPDMTRKETKALIKNEGSNGLSNKVGTLAMARTADPDSASSQFFINVKDNSYLDYKDPSNPGYAVFGKVIEGMDVVDKIKAVPTGMKGMSRDVPLEPVLIKSVKLVP
jgi:cyclophilin family peptidyl-prolyl cis-trans isomerase